MPTACFSIFYLYIRCTGGNNLIIKNFALRLLKDYEYSIFERQVLWQVGDVFFLCTSLVAVSFSIYMFFQNKRLLCEKMLAVFIALGLFFLSLCYIIFNNKINDEMQGIVLNITNTLFFEDIMFKKLIDPDALQCAIRLSQAFTALAFIALALATYFIVTRPSSPPHELSGSDDVDFKVRLMMQQAKGLRTLVFVGSANLIIGLATLYALFFWRAELAEAKHDIIHLGNIVVFIWIAVWTLCLLSLYLPCAVWLSHTIDLTYERAAGLGNAEGRQKWLEARGLNITYTDIIARLIALFVPIISTVLKVVLI